MTVAAAKFHAEHSDESPVAGMVKGRLREWAGWLHAPSFSAFPSSGIEYRILREQRNAGARGDGMKYEIIEVLGEHVVCRPDGGMWRKAQKGGRQLALDNRCIETHKAVERLPGPMRLVILKRWVRPDQRDKPLSFASVGEALQIPEETARDRHKAAMGRLERTIYGPFILAQTPFVTAVASAS